MGKNVLRTSFTSDAQLFGICSPLRDYRLAWFINENTSLELIRKDNWGAFGDTIGFANYKHKLKNIDASFHLISNKSPEGLLIPEKKEFEFLLLIRDCMDKDSINTLIAQVKRIPDVLLLRAIDTNRLKTQTVLLVD